MKKRGVGVLTPWTPPLDPALHIVKISKLKSMMHGTTYRTALPWLSFRYNEVDRYNTLIVANTVPLNICINLVLILLFM
jgi:hypothetical protein